MVSCTNTICTDWPGVCFYLCSAPTLHRGIDSLWQHPAAAENSTISNTNDSIITTALLTLGRLAATPSNTAAMVNSTNDVVTIV